MRSSCSIARAAVLLAAGILSAGCGPQGSSTPAKKNVAASPSSTSTEEHGHAHPTEGPHGGQLVNLGNAEYLAELVHDETDHKITVYLLDHAAERPVSSTEPEIKLWLRQGDKLASYVLKAVADPAAPETAGADTGSSQFELVDADLCEALFHAHEVRGRLQVNIQGKPYAGTIESHADDDHPEDADADDDHPEDADTDHDQPEDADTDHDQPEDADAGDEHTEDDPMNTPPSDAG